jgi:hypothetical protein
MNPRLCTERGDPNHSADLHKSTKGVSERTRIPYLLQTNGTRDRLTIPSTSIDTSKMALATGARLTNELSLLFPSCCSFINWGGLWISNNAVGQHPLLASVTQPTSAASNGLCRRQPQFSSVCSPSMELASKQVLCTASEYGTLLGTYHERSILQGRD